MKISAKFMRFRQISANLGKSRHISLIALTLMLAACAGMTLP